LTKRQLLFRVGSFAVAGLLLYLALRGVDLQAAWRALVTADYRWAVPLVGVVLAAHLLRAWRWQIWLAALPLPPSAPPPDGDTSRTPSPVPYAEAFVAMVVGYMVNYAAPRAGEVARTANLAARSRYRAGQVFGTVVTERLVDVACLALSLVATLVILAGQLDVLQERFFGPAWDRLSGLAGGRTWVVVAGALVLLALVGIALVWRIRRQGSALRQLWTSRVQPALADLREGLATLWTTPRPYAIGLATLGMWTCYVFMAYLPLLMLGLAEPYALSLLDAWALMTLGALGILIPAPGGIGAYHYLTIQALALLYAVPESPAATYAVLGHTAQMVFHLVVGAGGLVWQSFTPRDLTPDDPDDATAPTPSNKEATPAK
jgi:hypothetical protein